MAIETYSHKTENQTLAEFLAAAAEHRMALEEAGAVLDRGEWVETIIGGVSCRTMTWPVIEIARPTLVVPPPVNDDLPATDFPIVGDEDDGPEAA